MSRLQKATQAVRTAMKARMMISGPSGSGKTRAALIVASVLAEDAPILGIDTERESMLTYADDFAFDHLPWEPPYKPGELAETLAEAGEKYGVVIVDSATHFWRKEGGVLDIANGKFTGWKEARPVQEALVDAILTCPAHVILCVRAKVEHTQETVDGRQQVRKLGMAAQQDDDLEYELNVAIEMSMDHTATISKSRTVALPVNHGFRAGQLTQMAEVYLGWLKGGEPPAPAAVVKDLLGRMNALPDNVRRQCKDAFVAGIGRPDHLRESQVEAAETLVAKYEKVQPDEPKAAPEPSTVEPEPGPEDVRAATENLAEELRLGMSP